jgi:predicted amidohydrolase YtcJ
VLNSAALEAAGYREDGDPPEGGDFGRDAAGRLTGVVYEQALQDLAYPAMAKREPVVPPPAREDLLAALRRAQDLLHAAGITSVTDALVGRDTLDLYQHALARDLLSLRVGMLVTAEHWRHVEGLGLRTGFGSERLRLVGIKVVTDGAIAGRTCWVSEPFEGTDDCGMSTIGDDELREIVRAVHDAGSVVAVHANGDRAIRRVLDALAEAGATPARRHRIEHCTIVDDAILDDLARLGVVATPFATYVAYHGSKLRDWYGAGRLERMFPHRSFLDRGIPVAGASDHPAGPFEPLLGMQSCVTRRSLADGAVLGGSQRIAAREALELYTAGSAYAERLESVKGRLAPGYLADFAVLDEDPLAVDPEHISEIGVAETWVGGERVWAAS